MKKKSIKVPQQLTRAAEITRDGDSTTLSISSDVPYKRYDWWNDEEYWEVLDHGPGGIDEERLKAGLPILFNHDRDQHLARAKGYSNDGHKLTLNASEFIWASGDFAANKKADMESGALPTTSVGYELIGDGVCIGAKDEKPIYKFRFKVYEGSLVTIPADITVGAGRQRDHAPSGEPREISIKNVDSEPKPEHTQPTDPSTMNLTKSARSHFREADTGGNATAGASPTVDLAAERKAAREEFKQKCKKIDEFVANVRHEGWKKKAAEVAAKHKDGDANFDEFRAEALNFFTQETAIDEPQRSEVEVVGERGRDPRKRSQSIGALFVNSTEVRDLHGRLPRGRSVGIDIPNFSMVGIRGKIAMAQRAGFTSSDLSAVNITVNANILPLGVQRLTILDVIGSGTIGTGAYKYARENGFGRINGVAVAAGAMPRAQIVSESGLKPSWEADLSTETATVSKIAITTKVPDEFLSDFPSAMSYIDDRLPFMVDTETEFQVLYGDGQNDNLKGIFSTAGFQTRAVTITNDSTIAASMRQGLTDIQVGAQFEPDFFGFHPYDWETAMLLKDSQNRFLAGGPYYIPYTDGVYQERYTFWGKPVVVSTAITYGKPIAGAGKIGAAALIREGMRIEMTNSNEDDFRRNLVCIRAEHRLAVPVYRPVCFIQFTGFPARA